MVATRSVWTKAADGQFENRRSGEGINTEILMTHEDFYSPK